MTELNQNINIENRLAALETEVIQLKKAVFSDDVKSKPILHKKLSINEFLMSKNIDNDVKRTLGIAYFLEKFEGMASFNTDDLRKYYRLAKHPLPANPNDKVNMSIKVGFLMEAEEKKDSKKAWSLTSAGEKIVEDNFILNK